jgi:hypothetical protein
MSEEITLFTAKYTLTPTLSREREREKTLDSPKSILHLH